MQTGQTDDDQRAICNGLQIQLAKSDRPVQYRKFAFNFSKDVFNACSSENTQENPVRGEEAPPLSQERSQESPNHEPTLVSSTNWHVTRRMIYVRSNPKVAVGHWPIPESFWPDPGAQTMVSVLKCPYYYPLRVTVLPQLE